VVECGDEGMFWRVNAEHLLTVTRDFKEASVFHIVLSDDADSDDHFYIGWQGEELKENERLVAPSKIPTRIMRYLEVKTLFWGHCPGPLKFKSELSSKYSRLCLYNQISEGYFDSCEDDTAPWMEKGKVFFISNAAWKSFVSVVRYRNKEQADLDQEDAYGYTTKCMGSRRAHNEKDVWMLFRLIPTEQQKSFTERSKNQLSKKLTQYLETQ
jgi:hypothetical protein